MDVKSLDIEELTKAFVKTLDEEKFQHILKSISRVYYGRFMPKENEPVDYGEFVRSIFYYCQGLESVIADHHEAARHFTLERDTERHMLKNLNEKTLALDEKMATLSLMEAEMKTVLISINNILEK